MSINNYNNRIGKVFIFDSVYHVAVQLMEDVQEVVCDTYHCLLFGEPKLAAADSTLDLMTYRARSVAGPPTYSRLKIVISWNRLCEYTRCV